jgi:hypothetical protein
MLPTETLTDKALSALISFMQAHKEGPVTEREKGLLRFALAFLYRGGDREPFDAFWRAAMEATDGTEAGDFGRFQRMRSAYARIAAQHGRDFW